ncbi:MAG: hypothetical protein A2931_00985 [Candidatus Niyogibacteria bacterium RIFCSPLOWO2_01_FULL_45_48]|uniref:Nudix hydrolase domain-containing protein n=2 Tax=Candidatus Niyogiibacteriota TaxID=1817912 RepID=A0A1G2F122_9BACT|nr:MAG: hypothetical protein A2931_00985 [Candidatus Niyogibacteria bacterium RIFCSPLOWO2_01_FULL_45_48]OGZ30840.1 MAG: hypothetical protein A2835_00970 [Candidatus Niyogibacteria bacterium RIFCSPHIGHO2_01_FULL_45_28]OGZ31462.1 MAG: hypothetical protein A3J00_02470 [Candidatus Niyogibacteria bacterium RIFCSPLOWO2_02_FULL_45_13]
MKKIRAVAVVINGGKVLIMHRIKNGKEYYNFPGGGVEKGETVEQAVLREVKEETSLEIKIEKPLYHHIYDNGGEQFFYLCRYVSGEPKLDEGNELRDMQKGGANYYEPVWYEIGKISQLLFYPLEIKDWFLKDVKSDFKNTPREAKIKISDLRQLV